MAEFGEGTQAKGLRSGRPGRMVCGTPLWLINAGLTAFETPSLLSILGQIRAVTTRQLRLKRYQENFLAAAIALVRVKSNKTLRA